MDDSVRTGSLAAAPPRAVRHDDPRLDAVVADADASYELALVAPLADERERAVVSAQLGRPARGRPAVVHRCRFGLPTVVRVDPRLEDGTPFPTTFWLTCPALRSRVGTLEAEHQMVGLNQRIDDEPALAAGHAAAHERYLGFRARLGDPLAGDPGVGGMPDHVKCLHVHVGHHLATGDNPIGALAFESAGAIACRGPCVASGDEPTGSEER